MSIVCEIDQILANNQDYFVLKHKEFEQDALKLEENDVPDSKKFPLYSKEKNMNMKTKITHIKIALIN